MEPYEIDLDTRLYKGYPSMTFVKGDIGSNTIQITLTTNNKVLDLTGKYVTMSIKKPDNTEVVYNLEIIGTNIVKFTADANALASAGTVICTVEVYDGVQRITSVKFQYKVIDSLNSSDDIASFSDYPVLTALINDVQTAKEDIGTIGSLKDELTTKITDGDALNTNLGNNITTGTTLNNDLGSNINTGTTLKSDLETNINTGNTTKIGLDASISTGDSLKSSLETDINTAETKKTDLENVIATADTTTYATKGETGSIANLTTTDKTNLVAAINEHGAQLVDVMTDVGEFSANSTMPLNITTYDGSNQLTHTCIYDAGVANKWNGYRYWMVYTPYPYANDDYENPSLRASQDGLIWVKVSNVPDPIIPAPSDVGSGGFNSDPYITILNGTMYLFYRHTTSSPRVTTTYYITTTDAVNWASAVATDLYEALSPSFYYDGTNWHVWYVEQPTLKLKHGISSNIANWTIENCVHDLVGYTEWHLEVKKYDVFEMILSAYPTGTNEGSCKLFHLTSTDNINWAASNNKNPIIKPNPNSWDSKAMYKSTFLKDGNGYRVWYSGWSLWNTWFCGYCAGEEIEYLRGIDFNLPFVTDLITSGQITLTGSSNNGVLNFTGSGKHISSANALHITPGTDYLYINYSSANAKGIAVCGGTSNPLTIIDGDGITFKGMTTKHLVGNAGLHLKTVAGDTYFEYNTGKASDFQFCGGGTTATAKITSDGKGVFKELLTASGIDVDIKSGTGYVNINKATGQVRGMLFYGGGSTAVASIGGLGEARFQNIGVNNAVAASTLGTVVKKMEVFDINGNSLGFVPIYNSIT